MNYTQARQPVRAFMTRRSLGEIRINRADLGDANVVFSVTEDDGTFHPGVVGLRPADARKFARAILSAADVIDPSGRDDVEAFNDRHAG